MAELTPDARIRDLKRRLELDPTSRLFVSLAEEYRKAGRVADALITLQQGLRNHPGYVSAQVALGRAHLEAGNISEAIATFTKVLTADPGNLVSAKSLADIFFSRGESLEAIKKYKLYRALSGDRAVDDIIARLEKELAPPAPRSSRGAPPPPAPPTFFEPPPLVPSQARSSRGIEIPESPRGPIRVKEEILDVTSIKWEESTGAGKKKAVATSDLATEPFPVDAVSETPSPFMPAELPAAPLAPEASAPFSVEEAPERPESPATMPTPADEIFAQGADLARPVAAVDTRERLMDRFDSVSAPASADRTAEKPSEPPAGPAGRTLADLYFAQGHFAEALRIYDELVAANPFDAELKRLQRDAEARLLPAASAPGAARADPGLQRRLGKIRALKEWLSVVQAG